MNTITIITTTLLTVALIVTLWMIIKYKKAKKLFQKQLQNQIQDYKQQITDLQAEVTRLNYLLNELKKQKIVKNQPIETAINVKEILTEKQKLEQERQLLKEKTKKLWEQSLAIHKEKERIDKIRKEIAARHKEITDSITYASRIQTALLPNEDYIAQLFDEYFILWLPRDIVSGDFYWFNKIGHRIFVVVSDCTGHGVPGAFMSLLGISFLNEIVNANPSIQAHQLLEKMRQQVTEALRHSDYTSDDLPKDGMDMAVVIFEEDKNIMQYAGANLPLYLVRNLELIVYKPVKNPIGYYLVYRDFVKHDIPLQNGDIIYLFSDGFADQFGGPKNHKFTYKRFKELILEANKQKIPLKEQKDFFYKAFMEWKGDNRQIDDVMLIGIKWKKRPTMTIF